MYSSLYFTISLCCMWTPFIHITMVETISLPGLGNIPNPEAIFESWWPILFAIACGALFALRQYLRGARCLSEKKLKDCVVIVTGAASGIGRYTATDFAKRGARVYLACRTAEQAENAATQMRSKSKNQNVFGLKCDLASFKSVHEFVESFKKKEDKLHLLINNAAVMMCPKQLTEDKFESQFQINYLGHFLLTHLLTPTMENTDGVSRIVNVVAPAYQLGVIKFDDINLEEDYQPSNAYAQSKLALVFFSKLLARKVQGKGIIVNCANPGVTNTKIYRHLPFRKNAFLALSFAPIIWFLMKTSEDGAQTVLYCALAESAEQATGHIFKECEEAKFSDNANDDELMEKLLEESLKWTDVKEFGKEDK